MIERDQTGTELEEDLAVVGSGPLVLPDHPDSFELK